MNNLYGEKPLMHWTLEDVRAAVNQARYAGFKHGVNITFEDIYTKDACAYLHSLISPFGTGEYIIAEVTCVYFCYMPTSADMEYMGYNEICDKIFEHIKENYHWRAGNKEENFRFLNKIRI